MPLTRSPAAPPAPSQPPAQPPSLQPQYMRPHPPCLLRTLIPMHTFGAFTDAYSHAHTCSCVYTLIRTHTLTQTHHLLSPPSPFSSVQFSSVTQSCPTLCDPMNRSTPGLPVHHQLPVFTQTHVHRVSDAIQPSHPLPSPSPPAPNPSQHQSLFQ